MNGSTRPRRGRRRALIVASALLIGSGAVAGVAGGTALAVKGDPTMTVRTNEKGTECYYRPGQLIAPPGMASTIRRVTGVAAQQGPSLIPDKFRSVLPPTVQRLALYSIGSADPFDTAAGMAAAGYGSVAPNYLASFAPPGGVRTWAPGGESKPTVKPSPVTVGASGDGKGVRIGVFDTGLQRKVTSPIPGSGTVSYLPAQSLAAELSGQGFVQPGYLQPLELTSGRAAGHGTYITGLIRRVLPSASIVVSQVPFASAADAAFDVDTSPFFSTVSSSRADDAALTYMMYSAFLGAGGVTNVDVLSLSFGTYGCGTAFPAKAGDGDFRTPIGMRGAVLGLWERSGRKLIVSAAAGNDSTDEPFYPAAFSAMSCFDPANVPVNSPPPDCKPQPAAVSAWLGGVASTPSADIGSYSNYGPWTNVVANGSDLASVLHNLSWARWSGTSFAAPCAATYIAKNPGFTWASAAGRTIDCGLTDKSIAP